MYHKRNTLHLLVRHRLGQKMSALTIGLSTLVVALIAVVIISSTAPVAEAMSPIPRDEYVFLIDTPEMILVPHYPAGSETAFLVSNPEMILVPHYPAGSETAFLAANPEMILVPHYPAGSETALLVANPELIVAHMYYGFNARTASSLQ
jgi:hypothetical protein